MTGLCLQPAEESFEYGCVLLDDENDRLRIVEVESGRICRPTGEISVFGACRIGICNGLVKTGNQTYADSNGPVHVVCSGILRIESQKTFVNAVLCLTPQVVVYAGQNDNQVESGIGSLADQSRIVGRLAGLYLTDDKPFLVDDDIIALRIEQFVQNTVGQIVQLRDDLWSKMLLFGQIFLVSGPELPFGTTFRLELLQPGDTGVTSFQNLVGIHLYVIDGQQAFLQFDLVQPGKHGQAGNRGNRRVYFFVADTGLESDQGLAHIDCLFVQFIHCSSSIRFSYSLNGSICFRTSLDCSGVSPWASCPS